MTAKIAGVLTDIDLISGEWLSTDAESFAAMKRMTAGELMSTPVRMVDVEAAAADAAAMMRRDHLGRLLVVDAGSRSACSRSRT